MISKSKFMDYNKISFQALIIFQVKWILLVLADIHLLQDHLQLLLLRQITITKEISRSRVSIILMLSNKLKSQNRNKFSTIRDKICLNPHSLSCSSNFQHNLYRNQFKTLILSLKLHSMTYLNLLLRMILEGFKIEELIQ